MPRSFWTALLFCSAVVGCSNGEGEGDSDLTTCASRPVPSCCLHTCDNDVHGNPSCVQGEWVCPPDYVSSKDCPSSRFCQGPPVCNGSPKTISCCEHDCDNDITGDPSCVNGAWICPPDYVSSTYCPTFRFCQGPLWAPPDAGVGSSCDQYPGFTCCVAACTNHVTTSPFCDTSGWHCPAGSVSPEDCPGQPFCLGQ